MVGTTVVGIILYDSCVIPICSCLIIILQQSNMKRMLSVTHSNKQHDFSSLFISLLYGAIDCI